MLLVHTRRYKEHVGPEDTTNEEYGSRSMLETWKSKDPLIVNIDSLGKFKAEIEAEIDDAIKFAEDSAFPTASELFTDIV
jgi:pyruvate dehydrogenase E1 component alpha subunit